jgi:serine phosphatase RsbU (regulator of sigma subunit)
VLYTDGVTDLQSPTGERLAEDALQKSLYGSFRSAQDVLSAVLDAVDAHRAGREPADDLTLVTICLQRTPAPASAPPVSEPAVA